MRWEFREQNTSDGDRAHGRESYTSVLSRAKEPRLEPKLLRFLGFCSNNERQLMCCDDDDAIIATRHQPTGPHHREISSRKRIPDIELPLSPLRLYTKIEQLENNAINFLYSLHDLVDKKLSLHGKNNFA